MKSSNHAVRTLYKNHISAFPLLLISYAVVLVITFLGAIFLYSQAAKLIKTEATRANTAILLNARNTIEVKLKEIRNFSMSLANDLSCIDFVVNGRLDWKKESDLFKYLRNQNNYITIADYAYIISYSSNRVVSYNGIWDSDFLYQTQFASNMTQQDWTTLTESMNYGRFYPVVITTDSAEPKWGAACLTSFLTSPDVFSKPLGVAMVCADFTHLMDSVSNIQETYGGAMYILNESGTVIAASGDETLPHPEENDFILNESVTKEINGKDYMISSYPSEVTNWTYVSILPNDTYWEKNERLQTASAAILFTCLLAATLAAVYFSKRNYRPIRNLALNLGMPEQLRGNEYTLILESVNRLLKSKKEAEDALYRNQSTMSKQLIHQLLVQENSEEETIIANLNACGIQFDADFFTVIIFQIESYTDIFKHRNDREKLEAEKTIRFLVSNVGDELFGEAGNCYSTPTDNNVAFIVCTASDCTANLISIAKKLQGFFQKELEIGLSAAVSNAYVGNNNIAKAYAEALNISGYTFLLGQYTILSADDICKRTIPYISVYEERQKLINAVKLGQKEQAFIWLDRIFDKVYNSAITLEAAHCFLYDMVSISTALLNIETGQALPSNDTLFRLTAAKNIQQLKNEMTAMLNVVCNRFGENKKAQQMSENVIAYVLQQYQNPDLSVDSIGEHMHMTAWYMSKIFKAHVGTSLSDYIHLIRIDKAKELLISTNDTVASIAEQTGYLSANTFIRIFKKYESISPGKYREMKKMSN